MRIPSGNLYRLQGIKTRGQLWSLKKVLDRIISLAYKCVPALFVEPALEKSKTAMLANRKNTNQTSNRHTVASWHGVASELGMVAGIVSRYCSRPLPTQVVSGTRGQRKAHSIEGFTLSDSRQSQI
jgi:hypothetical protein